MSDTVDDNLLRVPSPHDLSLRNQNCIYCCRTLDKATRSREHVIGRQFVPKGTLDMNLIAWACRACNNEKSDLEDDISLISMLPAVAETLPAMDKRSAEIVRKAQRAVSRRTGKLVKDSRETFDIKGQIFPGVTATFTMVCNPQTDPDRVQRLAMFHVQAFHYFTTYKKDQRVGWNIPGVCAAAGDYRRPDWGNARLRHFMGMTKDWDPRFVFKGQEVFFKAIIRRRLPDELWSWAVEWNQSFRIIGFYGDENLVDQALDELPLLRGKSLIERPDRYVRMRTETALPEREDNLFAHDIAA
jgi:hypothetical protein